MSEQDNCEGELKESLIVQKINQRRKDALDTELKNLKEHKHKKRKNFSN